MITYTHTHAHIDKEGIYASGAGTQKLKWEKGNKGITAGRCF